MVAKPQAAPKRVKKWTLQDLRNRHSDLRNVNLDVDAWQQLRQWILPVVVSGWVVAFGLALATAWLVLVKTPHPATYVQEEHGMVYPLKIYPVPTGDLDGRH